mgnify:CR=1 FL=1
MKRKVVKVKVWALVSKRTGKISYWTPPATYAVYVKEKDAMVKKCPFCGGKAKLYSLSLTNDKKNKKVFCSASNCIGERWWAQEDKAIEAWNRRKQ